MLGMSLALLAAVGWGTSAVFARLALQHIPSAMGTLISLCSGFLLIATVALVVDFHALLTLSAVTFGWLLLVAFVNYPMGRFLSYNGIHLAGVTRATPIQATSPIFAALWAMSLGGERPGVFTLLGGVAIVLGVVLVVSEGWAQR